MTRSYREKNNYAELADGHGLTGVATRMRRDCAAGFISMASLFCGGAIYLLWRSPTLPMFRWVDLLGLTAIVSPVRAAFWGYRPHVPNLVLYSLPDALWLISLLILLDRIWVGSPRVALILTTGTAAFAIVMEFAQRWIPRLGTFSWQDVVALTMASAYLAIPIKRLVR